MYIKTDRMIIRDLKTADGILFSHMAADGSLTEIWIDREGENWMEEWMTEALELAAKDDPTADYMAYTMEHRETRKVIGIVYFVGAQYRNQGYAAEAIKAYAQYFLQRYKWDELIATIREDNAPSWKAIEKAGFVLTGKKLYQDIGDKAEKLYRFYSCQKQ